MATIDDLVRASGYSRSTVFRYLRGDAVRSAARDAILAAARRTGYDALLKPHRSDAALLLLAPTGFAGFRGFSDAVEGIMAGAEKAGIPLVFDPRQADGKRTVAICLGRRKDEEDRELENRIVLGQATVFLNRLIDHPDASWASVDFRAAAADGVGRLADAGCRRVACWAETENRRAELDKLAGARAAAEARGLELVVLGPEDGDAEEAARKALSGPGRPDGWFGFSDEIAMRALRAAASLGLSVPKDLSVVGMNDAEGSAYFTPALTSVRVPFRECGRAAVDLALRLLDHPAERSIKILLRHEMVERESCGPVLGAAEKGA